jgi:hypothetical protein
MDIRPQDLPELRIELANQLRDTAVTDRAWSHGQHPSDRLKTLVLGVADRTEAAEMYHVSEAMGALAAEASETLEKFALQPDDVPCATGLIVFDGEAPFEASYEDGCKNELRAIAWYADPNGSGVLVIPGVLPHGWLGRGSRVAMDPGSLFLAPFSNQIEELLGAGPVFDVFGLLLTVWLLMAQPLAEHSQAQPDRAARRRLQRAGHESAPIRVIELRRPKNSGGHGVSDREYHHQWIVKGHWRQQWHPKREVHRPVWIAPHIKGPDGAPLIGGEKVYAWKR